MVFRIVLCWFPQTIGLHVLALFIPRTLESLAVSCSLSNSSWPEIYFAVGNVSKSQQILWAYSDLLSRTQPVICKVNVVFRYARNDCYRFRESPRPLLTSEIGTRTAAPRGNFVTNSFSFFCLYFRIEFRINFTFHNLLSFGSKMVNIWFSSLLSSLAWPQNRWIFRRHFLLACVSLVSFTQHTQ